jgi:predicted nuclease of predicted toxin-antitoxin system
MARTIRFHLDENCHPAIAGGLRRRGVDVTTTPEVGLLHASDEKQIAYALPLGRVIFTQDRDFLKLHAASVPHAGIAYCDKDTKSIGEIITMLILIWEVYEPEEMANRVEFIWGSHCLHSGERVG